MYLFEKLFPFIYNRIDENKILHRQEKIKNMETFDTKVEMEYSDIVKQTDIEKLSKLYDEAIIAKGKLEDKAKSMTIAITVSVTLILGLSNTILQIFNLVSIYYIKVFFAISGIIAIGYMIIAGLYSAKIFLTNIMIYKINETEKNIRYQYKKCTILNRLSNNVRSNYIYTSYECLRNSLLILFFIFTFLIIVA